MVCPAGAKARTPRPGSGSRARRRRRRRGAGSPTADGPRTVRSPRSLQRRYPPPNAAACAPPPGPARTPRSSASRRKGPIPSHVSAAKTLQLRLLQLRPEPCPSVSAAFSAMPAAHHSSILQMPTTSQAAAKVWPTPWRSQCSAPRPPKVAARHGEPRSKLHPAMAQMPECHAKARHTKRRQRTHANLASRSVPAPSPRSARARASPTARAPSTVHPIADPRSSPTLAGWLHRRQRPASFCPRPRPM
mmetsp:Transcript_128438/g.411747  ORF Transcript_128438/g.411747 Transcript_128438/m.411747 type:complete len:247 (-) Transcript_128438:106-846(-)